MAPLQIKKPDFASTFIPQIEIYRELEVVQGIGVEKETSKIDELWVLKNSKLMFACLLCKRKSL